MVVQPPELAIAIGSFVLFFGVLPFGYIPLAVRASIGAVLALVFLPYVFPACLAEHSYLSCAQLTSQPLEGVLKGIGLGFSMSVICALPFYAAVLGSRYMVSTVLAWNNELPDAIKQLRYKTVDLLMIVVCMSSLLFAIEQGVFGNVISSLLSKIAGASSADNLELSFSTIVFFGSSLFRLAIVFALPVMIAGAILYIVGVIANRFIPCERSVSALVLPILLLMLGLSWFYLSSNMGSFIAGI